MLRQRTRYVTPGTRGWPAALLLVGHRPGEPERPSLLPSQGDFAGRALGCRRADRPAHVTWA